jgi:hypothetical protein
MGYYRLRATILLKACLQTPKRCHAPVKRHPQCRPFASHLKNIGDSHSLIERPICQRNRHALVFRQRLDLNCARTRRQRDIVGLAPIELPFRRIEQQEQTIASPQKRYVEIAHRPAHRTIVEFIGLE